MRHPPFLLTALLLVASLARGEAQGDPVVVVSPRGNDAGDGSVDKPFATIGRAQRAVRERLAQQPAAHVVVCLRGGNHFIGEPIRFAPGDAGGNGGQVTFAAWPDESAIIHGGRVITGWEQREGNLWTVQLPEVKAGKWVFRQLFRGESRLTRARFPNVGDWLKIQSVSDDLKTLRFDRPIPWELSDGDAEVVVELEWSIARVLVANATKETVVTRSAAGFVADYAQMRARAGSTAYLENDRAFLDAPGEWFLDRKSGVLSYVAAEGEDPNQSEIAAPVAAGWLAIEGTTERPVQNLRFEGITFACAEPPFPPEGHVDVQAGHFHIPHKDDKDQSVAAESAAVVVVRASGCEWERCRFRNTGTTAVAFGPGVVSSGLAGCKLDDIGGNGVMIGWRNRAELQDGRWGKLDADWKDDRDIPRGNFIRNCLVTRCGQWNTGGVGIFVAFSAQTAIEHNEVHTMPYTGISLGYCWDTVPSSMRECSVRWNSIHEVMLELADGSGLYTLGVQPGTVIEENWVRNVRRHRSGVGAPNNGFFFDEGSKGFTVANNLIHDTAGAPIRFNKSEEKWHTFGKNYFGQTPADSKETRAIADAAGIPKAFRW